MQKTRKRRTNLEICIAVLEASMEKSRRTSIAERTGLNFKYASKYVNSLHAHKFLMKSRDNRFTTTKTGEEFLEDCRRISHITCNIC